MIARACSGVNTFPPFAPFPVERLRVREADDGFIVPGVAHVRGKPFRSWPQARELAHRIGAARLYLSFCVFFQVPGVVDLRPGRSAEPTVGARKVVHNG